MAENNKTAAVHQLHPDLNSAEWPGYPTVSEAYEASQELLHLMRVFPMQRTWEEIANNMTEQHKAIGTMAAFIERTYLQSLKTTTQQ